jgi:hypothetical protein
MKTFEVSIEALKKAILDLHGCKATWIRSVPVKEIFEEDIVWEGVVDSPEKAVRAAIVRDQSYHGIQGKII